MPWRPGGAIARAWFILTLCGFLAVFVALTGATVVSNTLAGPVSQAIRPAVEHQIQTAFQHKADVEDGPVRHRQQPECRQTPPWRRRWTILKDSKFYQGFVEGFPRPLNDGIVAATTNAARAISDYVARQIAKTVLSAVAFVLILVLWFILSQALDLAFKLPVLSTLNRWSGGALGLFEGVLLVFIACWLLLKGGVLPEEVVENSHLLKLL
ncbi:MAG: CvpA family protein [Lawsonibacter sp.]